MIKTYIDSLFTPEASSHKGQNGKVLVIAGSALFHAPLLWAAEVASKIVDMVHVASPAEVNERLMRERLRQKFWNGIVVPWSRVEEYIAEDDCVLIGPGMPRDEGLEVGEKPTGEIVNDLLRRYPTQRWVIDGGALQTVEPALLTGSMIVTPHQKEWERLGTDPVEFSKQHNNVVVLRKGMVDVVARGEEREEIIGGNAGMTKGGTGDVLAGLTTALAAKNDLLTAAVVASWVNKRAGDRLYSRVGSFYNASDLVAEIPHVLHELTR